MAPIKRVRLAATIVMLASFLTVSTAAQAHEFKVNKNPIAAGVTWLYSGVSGETTFETKVMGAAVTVKCPEDINKGGLKEGGKFTLELLSVKCSMTGLPTCLVKSLTLNVTAGLLVHEPVEAEFKSAGAVGILTLEGAECALSGANAITGIQICKLPEATVEKLVHKIECTVAGSTLKFGTEPAKYSSTEELALNEFGKEWSAV